jgi:hypothetical protein
MNPPHSCKEEAALIKIPFPAKYKKKCILFQRRYPYLNITLVGSTHKPAHIQHPYRRQNMLLKGENI